MRQRWLEQYRQIDSQLAALQQRSPLPRGHVPRDLDLELQQGVGRYVHWFYSHEVGSPTKSIRSLGKAFHADRATVRRGIHEAKRLLSLTETL